MNKKKRGGPSKMEHASAIDVGEGFYWTTCTVYPNLSPFSWRYSTFTFSPTAGRRKGMNFVFSPTRTFTTSAASPSSMVLMERLFGEEATTSPDKLLYFCSSVGTCSLGSSFASGAVLVTGAFAVSLRSAGAFLAPGTAFSVFGVGAPLPGDHAGSET